MPFMQKQIIAYFPEEINPFFKKILDPAAKKPGDLLEKSAPCCQVAVLNKF